MTERMRLVPGFTPYIQDNKVIFHCINQSGRIEIFEMPVEDTLENLKVAFKDAGLKFPGTHPR